MVEQKVYFSLDKRTSTKGKSIIQVRLNQSGVKQMRSTGHKITPSLWNHSEQVVTNRRQRTADLEEERVRLLQLFGQYQSKIYENQELLLSTGMPFTLDDVLQYGNSSKGYAVRSA